MFVHATRLQQRMLRATSALPVREWRRVLRASRVRAHPASGSGPETGSAASRISAHDGAPPTQGVSSPMPWRDTNQRDALSGRGSIGHAAQRDELQVTPLGMSQHHGVVLGLTGLHHDLEWAVQAPRGL